ncbi:MAG: SDR family NAD(P)-dependent oxidoreductase [Clostridia bacterium]
MNKVALVTGGSRGIGKAVVIMLAKEGYHVFLNYNKSVTQAIDIKKELANDGFSIDIIKADISIFSEVETMMDFVFSKVKKIDLLVNNAGVSVEKMFTDCSLADFDKVFDTNVKGTFLVTKHIAKKMVKQHSGNIINISSIWGITGASCETIYSASKAAIIGLTKALAKELGPTNIRVNCIAPGMIATDMNAIYSDDEIDAITNDTPLMRIGKPEDIARCVKWLAEDEFTTGQVISPNGGWVI